MRYQDVLTFTLLQSANAVEVRYSLPDAPTGGGRNATLRVSAVSAQPQHVPISLNVSPFFFGGAFNASAGHKVYTKKSSTKIINNKYAKDSTLIDIFEIGITSQLSWAYGSYPFSDDPTLGRAHHFYDEVYIVHLILQCLFY